MGSGLGKAALDMHEFKVINRGSIALITIYQPIQYDLSIYNLTTALGWIMDNFFQEVDIWTGKVLFE